LDLATFCAGLQVSSQLPTHTASGADALTILRLPDPGMEKFYRRLMGTLLASLKATEPSPRLPSIIRAMIWDFAARTANPADITLWFGCDSPITASAPLLSSGSQPSLEDSHVYILFGGYRDFKREAQIWPIPFDPADEFARQGDAWRRLRRTGGQLYSVAYSAAVPVDLMAKSFACLAEVSGPPDLLLLDTFSSVDTSALGEFHVRGWRSETIVDREFSSEPRGEGWRILVSRFTEA
jgi:hypothetical protein